MAKYLVAILFALAALLIYANAHAQIAPDGMCGPAGPLDQAMRAGPNGPIIVEHIMIPADPQPLLVTIYRDQKNTTIVTLTDSSGITCVKFRGEWHSEQQAS